MECVAILVSAPLHGEPADRMGLAKGRAPRARLFRMRSELTLRASQPPLTGAWSGFVYFYFGHAEGRTRP
jgi:hypothetical protein